MDHVPFPSVSNLEGMVGDALKVRPAGKCSTLQMQRIGRPATASYGSGYGTDVDQPRNPAKSVTVESDTTKLLVIRRPCSTEKHYGASVGSQFIAHLRPAPYLLYLS